MSTGILERVRKPAELSDWIGNDDRKLMQVARGRLFLTQAQMGKLLGIGTAAVSKIERGERGLPARAVPWVQALLDVGRVKGSHEAVKRRIAEGDVTGAWRLVLTADPVRRELPSPPPPDPAQIVYCFKCKGKHGRALREEHHREMQASHAEWRRARGGR